MGLANKSHAISGLRGLRWVSAIAFFALAGCGNDSTQMVDPNLAGRTWVLISATNSQGEDLPTFKETIDGGGPMSFRLDNELMYFFDGCNQISRNYSITSTTISHNPNIHPSTSTAIGCFFPDAYFLTIQDLFENGAAWTLDQQNPQNLALVSTGGNVFWFRQ